MLVFPGKCIPKVKTGNAGQKPTKIFFEKFCDIKKMVYLQPQKRNDLYTF
jgi:hypothetical protein